MGSNWTDLQYERSYHVSCNCIFSMKFDGTLIGIRRNNDGEYVLTFREIASRKNIEVGTNSPGLLVQLISEYGSKEQK